MLLRKHYKTGDSANLDISILGAKRLVNKWSIIGSISGPHFGSNF